MSIVQGEKQGRLHRGFGHGVDQLCCDAPRFEACAREESFAALSGESLAGEFAAQGVRVRGLEAAQQARPGPGQARARTGFDRSQGAPEAPALGSPEQAACQRGLPEPTATGEDREASHSVFGIGEEFREERKLVLATDRFDLTRSETGFSDILLVRLTHRVAARRSVFPLA